MREVGDVTKTQRRGRQLRQQAKKPPRLRSKYVHVQPGFVRRGERANARRVLGFYLFYSKVNPSAGIFRDLLLFLRFAAGTRVSLVPNGERQTAHVLRAWREMDKSPAPLPLKYGTCNLYSTPRRGLAEQTLNDASVSAHGTEGCFFTVVSFGFCWIWVDGLL